MNTFLVKAAQAAITTATFKAQRVSVGTARSNGRLPKVTNGQNITLGNRVGFGGRQFPADIGASPSGKLAIGDRCYINQGVTIWAEDKVTIGEHVYIGDLSAIYDTSFHELTPGDVPAVAPVTIHDDVWLGRMVTVMPGVTIGRGAVIAAHSVVTEDIPAFAMAAGVPAKVKRQLPEFPEGTHRN